MSDRAIDTTLIDTREARYDLMKLQNCCFGLASLILPLATTLALLLPAPSLHADLVSYWNFDDGATVTDQVGSNDGTLIPPCRRSLPLLASSAGTGRSRYVICNLAGEVT